MDLFIFRAANGFDVAISEEGIVAIWQAKDTPGNCIIELAEDRKIEIVYEFDKLVADHFDRADLRPLPDKGKVKAKPKAPTLKGVAGP